MRQRATAQTAVSTRGGLSLDAQFTAFMASLTGPRVLLDPSRASFRFQDAAGSTLVTADGQPFARLNDASGAGNHVAQSTAASMPLYRTDGALHWAEADGINDSWQSLANFNLSGTDKVTIVAGLRKRSNSGRAQFVELGASGAVAGSFGMTVPEDATGALSVARNGGLGNGATNSAATSASLACVESVAFDLAGTTHATQTPTFRINGVAAGVSNSGLANTGQGPFASAVLNLFRRNNASFPAAVDFFGLMIIGRLLTAAELWLCERWMASKSGVTI